MIHDSLFLDAGDELHPKLIIILSTVVLFCLSLPFEKTHLPSYTMKLSFLATVIAMTSVIGSVSGSYAGSCRNCRLEKRSAPWLSGDDEAPMLICECGNGSGGWPTTKKDLNQCLMNKDGFILPRKK
jgi:hypothetical protein